MDANGYYAEAEQLLGWNAQALYGMVLWAERHAKNKAAMKEASAAWHRNARTFAKSAPVLRRVFPDQNASPDELLSVIAIMGLDKAAASVLLEQWRDHTMSYADVREAVQARKGRKSKGVTLKDKLAALIKELDADSVCGAGLEVVCTRRAIADKLRNLLGE